LVDLGEFAGFSVGVKGAGEGGAGVDVAGDPSDAFEAGCADGLGFGLSCDGADVGISEFGGHFGDFAVDAVEVGLGDGEGCFGLGRVFAGSCWGYWG
jgi:hypothetical protein